MRDGNGVPGEKKDRRVSVDLWGFHAHLNGKSTDKAQPCRCLQYAYMP